MPHDSLPLRTLTLCGGLSCLLLLLAPHCGQLCLGEHAAHILCGHVAPPARGTQREGRRCEVRCEVPQAAFNLATWQPGPLAVVHTASQGVSVTASPHQHEAHRLVQLGASLWTGVKDQGERDQAVQVRAVSVQVRAGACCVCVTTACTPPQPASDSWHPPKSDIFSMRHATWRPRPTCRAAGEAAVCWPGLRARCLVSCCELGLGLGRLKSPQPGEVQIPWSLPPQCWRSGTCWGHVRCCPAQSQSGWCSPASVPRLCKHVRQSG